MFQSTLPVRGATKYHIHRRKCIRFQSTLPVRGATLDKQYGDAEKEFQSTLPVWGATRLFPLPLTPVSVSIHAPRAGSDKLIFFIETLFNSVSIHAPRAGSDADDAGFVYDQLVSIHAPRAGSDCISYSIFPVKRCFNPRSPCGERLAPDGGGSLV